MKGAFMEGGNRLLIGVPISFLQCLRAEHVFGTDLGQPVRPSGSRPFRPYEVPQTLGKAQIGDAQKNIENGI
jgi:hypothetical protein